MVEASFPPVAEQMAILTRGVVDLHAQGELEKRLTESHAKGKPLRVKAGFDPTVPDLHLGHTVLMNKMRQFQRLGHEVVFLIGDFTAQIGDPTGRNELRPPLTKEQVRVAAETYAKQAFRVLDKAVTRIEYNASWCEKLTPVEIVKLTSKYTVARMLERDDFKKRYSTNVSIHLHEFLYPLMQGYDSVVLKPDIELGGQDQLFNLLVGRDLMKDYELRPQMVMTTPLLLGLDARLDNGVLTGDKMSKSKGNYIALEEAPRDMFGKVMSISDDLMWNWYEHLSELSPGDLSALRSDVQGGRKHPKQAKEQLAVEIVARFHGKAAGEEALAEFARIFSKQGVPDDIKAYNGAPGLTLVDHLVGAGMADSKGEARRLLQQGGVSREGEKLSDPALVLPSGEHVLKVGKHRFVKLIVG